MHTPQPAPSASAAGAAWVGERECGTDGRVRRWSRGWSDADAFALRVGLVGWLSLVGREWRMGIQTLTSAKWPHRMQRGLDTWLGATRARRASLDCATNQVSAQPSRCHRPPTATRRPRTRRRSSAALRSPAFSSQRSR